MDFYLHRHYSHSMFLVWAVCCTFFLQNYSLVSICTHPGRSWFCYWVYLHRVVFNYTNIRLLLLLPPIMEKTGGRCRGKGEGKVKKVGSGARRELTLIYAAWYASLPPLVTSFLAKKFTLFGLPWQLCRFLDPGWDPLSLMEKKEMPWRRKCG